MAENTNTSFFTLDKAAAAWHYGEIQNPHSKAEYAAMWNREKKRYNLEEYTNAQAGGYNRTDFLPAQYEVSRKYREPRISLDTETGGNYGWRDTLQGSSGDYVIKSFDDVFTGADRRDLMMTEIRQANYQRDLACVARWYPQWTINWNQSANVAFFLLNALYELSKKGPAYLSYGHLLILEADYTRGVDSADNASGDYIEKLGGLEAVEKARLDLNVGKVSDYKFPSTFRWTFNTGIDQDDPQDAPYEEFPVTGAELLTQEAFGALSLDYERRGVAASDVDRFAGPYAQSNPKGIITGAEFLASTSDDAALNTFLTDTEDVVREANEFTGFRWKNLLTAEEQKRGFGNPSKYNVDGSRRAGAGRLACNDRLKATFKLLREEPEFDNLNYYRLYGAWIDEESTVASTTGGADTVYPKMTEWCFEPIQNSFGFDEEPNKADVFLLYLEARVRSKRGAAALGAIAKAAAGSGAAKAWAKWVGDFLFEEAIRAQADDLPTHIEPELVDGKVTFRQKFGKSGNNPVVNKATGQTQRQEGHWMRLGRLTTQDDAASRKADGQDYWMNNYSPAAGTCSAWILGDDGAHREVWFSTAKDASEETSRALYAGRPPYQTLASLPAGSIIEDEDLIRDDRPWDGPNDLPRPSKGGDYSDYDSYGDDYGYDSYNGDNYDDSYGYGGYSGYSNYDYSY